MDGNLKFSLLNQTIFSICMLIFTFLGFAMAWVLFDLKDSKEKKRPGINIKDF